MDCERVRLNLSSYLTGELGEKQQKSLEQHAEKCRECRSALKSSAWVWRELGHISLRCPNIAKMRMQQRLASLTAPPNSFSRPFSYLKWGAAAIAISLLCLWLGVRDNGIPNAAVTAHINMNLPREVLEEPQVEERIVKLLGIRADIHIPRRATLLGTAICRLKDLISVQVIYQYRGAPISLFVWDRRWPHALDGIPSNRSDLIAFKKQQHTVLFWENSQVCYCLVANIGIWELAGIFGLPTNIEQQAAVIPLAFFREF